MKVKVTKATSGEARRQLRRITEQLDILDDSLADIRKEVKALDSFLLAVENENTPVGRGVTGDYSAKKYDRRNS